MINSGHEFFSKRLSNGSATQETYLEGQQGRRSSGSLDIYGSPRNRSRSRVSFTIGDSSDCESGITTSGSVTTEGRHSMRLTSEGNEEEPGLSNGAALVNGIANPWRKYHFQSMEHGKANGDIRTNQQVDGGGTMSTGESGFVGRPANGDIRRSSIEEEEELELLSPTASTGLMIPNYPAESLARLDDVISENGEGDGSALGNCRGGWGKWRILVACSIVQLFSALMVSLQAPFYPAEAEKKGSSAMAYGFVFGAFELTVFFVAPFYGSRIHRWNPKLVFHIGIFIAAISSIIFGLLDQIPSGQYFIIASAFVRAMEALGESAVITSSFIIVASAFPDSVASTFAIVETFYSVGLISGPIVGSVLYQLGGYSVPFMVVGGLLLAASVLSFVILPSSRQISEYQGDNPVIVSTYRSFRLLGIGGITVSALCIVLGALSISFLQATLEPHLRQFGISQLTTGAILVINGAVYTITAPFWGLICDKVVQLKLVCFCGIAVLVCGFSLIGPVPLLHFEQKLWITSVGLTLQGIGLGAVLVSSFVSILQQAIRKGLPDSPSTYGLVSSLWTSMFSLGSFVGPSLSGVLYDTIGFANGTLSVIGFAFFMMAILLIFMFISDSELESFVQSETEPLLNNSAGVSASFYSNNEPQPCSSKSITRNGWTNGPNTRKSSYGSTLA